MHSPDQPGTVIVIGGALKADSQAVWQRIVDDGGQVLCATHSPVLAALPGARILEVGEWGLRRTEYDHLELVRTWRSFLESPQRFLRHLT